MQLPTWTQIKADLNGFIAKVRADLVYLAGVGHAVIDWVEKEDPQAKAVIAQLVQSAENDAVLLEQAAAKGLGTLVDNATDVLGTVVAQAVAAAQLPTGAGGVLTSFGAAALTDISQILHAIVSNELVKAVAITAPKPVKQ